MRLLWVLALSVASIACGKQGNRYAVSEDPRAAAKANDGKASSANAAIHSLRGWDKAIAFKVDAAFDAGQVESIKNAAATWNEAAGRELLRFAGTHEGAHGKGLYDSLNDSETVIYFESAWKRTTGKQSSTLATTVWENAPSDEELIDRGDIIMNGEFYVFADAMAASEPNDGRALADTESVILHEMGHLLGLNHVAPEDDAESVMLAYAMIGEGVQHRVPSTLDVTHIRQIYDK